MNIATCIGCGCNDFRACCNENTGQPCSWLVVDREAGLGVCSECSASLGRRQDVDRTTAAVMTERAARQNASAAMAFAQDVELWCFDEVDVVTGTSLEETLQKYEKETGVKPEQVEKLYLPATIRIRMRDGKAVFANLIEEQLAGPGTFSAILAKSDE